jgi:uncharacterized membrane protein
MDEPERDSGCDVVDDDVVTEILADAPVPFPGDPIVDPPTARSLEQRVAQDQHESAPAFERPRHLPDGLLEGVDVLERQAQHHVVERLVATGEGVGTSPRVTWPPGALTSEADLGRGGIDADDLDPGTRNAAGDLAFAAADVEDAAGLSELVGDHREDLVRVLAVRARGELSLPPRGVAFPEDLVVGAVPARASLRLHRRLPARRVPTAMYRPPCTEKHGALRSTEGDDGGARNMDIGPVEILVVAFPGNQFTGEVAPALAELVQSGLLRVIDLVFVTKDAEGAVVGVELSELADATGAAFGLHVEEPSGLIADEDIEDLAAELEPNSSAAILLVEHLWATKFRDAVLGSGGELVAAIRIPKEVVDEVVGAS